MNSEIACYVRVLRTRWRWMVWGVLLATGAATALLILQPPMYQAHATVFVRTPGDVSRVVDGGDAYAQRRAKTYAAVANSPSVTARVVDDLDLDLAPEVLSQRIKATNRSGTTLIDITVSAPSAMEAQQTATVLLSEFTATVHMLESVPGSLVPRADLIAVDPPGLPTRLIAWGLPIPVVLSAAVLIGLVVGATGAVVRSMSESAELDRTDGARVPAGSHADQETRRTWNRLTRPGRAKR